MVHRRHERTDFVADRAQGIADLCRLGIVIFVFHAEGCRHGIDWNVAETNAEIAPIAFVDRLELSNKQLYACGAGEIGQHVRPGDGKLCFDLELYQG